jgi:SPP1 family predicted phage head-tail adaptor
VTDRIGAARHRAALQSKVLTPDGGGGFGESWETYATVWASLEIGRGVQSLQAGRLESRGAHRLVIRRRSDVSVNHRVLLGARILAIRAIEDEGPQALWMALACEEGTSL